MKRSAVWQAVLVFLMAIASCASPETDPNREPYVVATLPVVGHLVTPVAGDAVDVRVLVQRPVSAHAYELRPSEAALVADAAGVFSASRGVDGWITSYAGSDVHRLFADDSHGWADPMLAAEAVLGVGARLCELLPDDCEAFTERATTFSDSLGRMTEQVRARLSAVTPGTIALSEPFFAPFMERFHLGTDTILRTVPEHDPSPASVRRAVEGAAGIQAVIVPSTTRDRLAEELANARAWVVIPIDPIALSHGSYSEWLTASVDTLLARLPGS